MRQVVLDTETTGLEPSAGHRIIEIGCIELVNRRITNRRFHQYINPEREIDPGAVEVHGLTTDFLASKPKFVDIMEEFLDFIIDAELIIHNAPFDVGFIDAELSTLSAPRGKVNEFCKVFDTLTFARELHPGQRNSLDALCRRYEIDNAHRDLHGALLDAELLADVYLAMTGGQVDLSLDANAGVSSMDGPKNVAAFGVATPRHSPLRVVQPTAEEIAEHERMLSLLEEKSTEGCVWMGLP